MNRMKNMKMKDMSNEDIFSIYTEYIRDEITKDINRICEKRPRLVDSGEPWVFRIDK